MTEVETLRDGFLRVGEILAAAKARLESGQTPTVEDFANLLLITSDVNSSGLLLLRLVEDLNDHADRLAALRGDQP